MIHQRSSGDLLADRRYAYAEDCLAGGDAVGAAEMAVQALEIAPRYLEAWALLARAWAQTFAASGSEADRAAGLRACTRALELDREDPLGVGLTRVRLDGTGGVGAITQAYVRALFDGYATRFEDHLVGNLGYRGPAVILAALDAAGATGRFPVALDLGCGTGLMGAALRARVDRLTGVDLSSAMLVRARRGGHYDHLVEADLVSALAAQPPDGADLVVAADVFIYLDDLFAPLARIARALGPEGVAAFTVQSHPGPGVILGADGRYAHGDPHLRAAAAAAGLAPLLLDRAAVRRERGREVPGRVVVLRWG